MPIIIRETVIRADVSGNENANSSSAADTERGTSGTVSNNVEAQVQKILSQIEKKREER